MVAPRSPITPAPPRPLRVSAVDADWGESPGIVEDAATVQRIKELVDLLNTFVTRERPHITLTSPIVLTAKKRASNSEWAKHAFEGTETLALTSAFNLGKEIFFAATPELSSRFAHIRISLTDAQEHGHQFRAKLDKWLDGKEEADLFHVRNDIRKGGTGGKHEPTPETPSSDFGTW